jgi:cell division protein ZapA
MAMDITKALVQVQIYGSTYTIRGEADQDYILSVAAYLDRKMREITEKLPAAAVSSSLSKVAVLAGLNIADELMKERARRATLEEQLSVRAARLNAVLDDVLQDRTT